MIRKYDNGQIPILIFTLFTLCLFSCDSQSPIQPEFELPEFNANPYSLQSLEFERRWFNERVAPGFELNFPHDADGVILSEWDGDYYYHPFAVCNQGINYWVGFERLRIPHIWI